MNAVWQSIQGDFENRPLLAGCFGLIAGIALHAFPIMIAVLMGVGWLCRRSTALIWLGAFLLIGLWVSPRPAMEGAEATWASGEYSVTSVPSPTANGFVFDIEQGESHLVAFWNGSDPPILADTIQVQTRINPVKSRPEMAALQGTTGTVSISSKNSSVLPSGSGIHRFEFTFAARMRDFVKRDLGGRNGALMAGLAFNDSSALTPRDKTELETTGTLFLIAASGLHLFIFEELFMALFAKKLVPRSLRLALFGIFILFYAGSTGYHPATVRAGIMTLIAASAYLWNRQYDGLSALSLAGMAYLLWRPDQLFTPGFQLSMLAVLALILGHDVWRNPKAHLATTSFWGWAGSTPIGAFWFKVVAWTGPLACLLPVILLGPAVALCLVDYGLHSALPVLAAPISFILKFIAALLWKWLDFFASIRAGSSIPSAISGYWLFGLYGAFVIVMRALKPNRGEA